MSEKVLRTGRSEDWELLQQLRRQADAATIRRVLARILYARPRKSRAVLGDVASALCRGEIPTEAIIQKLRGTQPLWVDEDEHVRARVAAGDDTHYSVVDEALDQVVMLRGQYNFHKIALLACDDETLGDAVDTVSCVLHHVGDGLVSILAREGFRVMSDIRLESVLTTGG